LYDDPDDLFEPEPLYFELPPLDMLLIGFFLELDLSIFYSIYLI